MEILEECRKIVSNGNNKELVEKTEYSDNFIKAMIETDNFNVLYNMLDDEYSKDLFKKIIKYRYMLAFYPEVHQNIKKEIMFSFKYGTISTYKWLSKMISFLIFKRMSLPKEIGAFALFHIFEYEAV